MWWPMHCLVDRIMQLQSQLSSCSCLLCRPVRPAVPSIQSAYQPDQGVQGHTGCSQTSIESTVCVHGIDLQG